MAQEGILHLGDIAVDTEDGLGLIHHSLQFILETKGFFEIHFTHSLFLSLVL